MGKFKIKRTEGHFEIVDNSEIHIRLGLIDYIYAFTDDLRAFWDHRVDYIDRSSGELIRLIFDRGGIWDVTHNRFLLAEEIADIDKYHAAVKNNTEVYYNV